MFTDLTPSVLGNVVDVLTIDVILCNNFELNNSNLPLLFWPPDKVDTNLITTYNKILPVTGHLVSSLGQEEQHDCDQLKNSLYL